MDYTTIDEYFTLSIREFCRRSGMGETLCRGMIADGRLRSVRVGKKKILVDVASWREYLRKQAVEGVPEYDVAQKARAVRTANHQARHKSASKKVDLADLELL